MSVQSAYNGMMSAHRNMFLTSAVAVTMIAFTKSFKNWYIDLLAICLLFMSATIGIMGTNDFKFFLKNNEIDPDSFNLENLMRWQYIGYGYALFLIIIGLGLLIRFFMKL